MQRGQTKVVYVRAKVPTKPPVEDRWPADPKEFGSAIRQSRQAARLSQITFAKQIGISDATLRSIEHGRHSLNPAVRSWIVEALAKLGITAQ